MHKRLKIILRYMIPTMIVLVGVPFLQRTGRHTEPFGGERLRCAIATDSRNGMMAFPVGYNYEMLELFAGHIGKDAEIFLGDSSCIDSLVAGSVDIVVYPYSDSLVMDKEFLVSVPLADSSSWITGGRMKEEHKAVNLWLSQFFLTDSHKRIAGRFTPSYEPYKRANDGMVCSTLSPYDKLMRKYSAELGWDREMLTALIWQESRFRIEAQSRRGALGLMQIMPRTAEHFDAGDMLDPEENLAAGVRYLKYLQNLFGSHANDSMELVKLTLAAYNAGEGRISDCMAYAASAGKPNATWDDLVAMISDMRNDAVSESGTVKPGRFIGYETIAYVGKVLELHEVFRTLSGAAAEQ